LVAGQGGARRGSGDDHQDPASLAEAVRSAVKANHSYTTPAILVVAIESGDADYLGWLLAETKPAP